MRAKDERRKEQPSPPLFLMKSRPVPTRVALGHQDRKLGVVEVLGLGSDPYKTTRKRGKENTELPLSHLPANQGQQVNVHECWVSPREKW